MRQMSGPHSRVEGAAKHPVRGYLPVLVFLAFAAFLLTGFGAGLGALQPIPVYLFLCLVLLTLQAEIGEQQTPTRALYTFLTSSFAVLYAGEVVYGIKQVNFTRNPATYVTLNAILLTVFLADVLVRRSRVDRPTTPSARYGRWAVEAGALAVFFSITAFLLDLLGGQVVLQRLGFRIGKPYVTVDLNQMFHLSLGSPANMLEGLNLVLGICATALALGLLVVAGVLLPSPNNGSEEVEVARSVWAILRSGVVRVLFSLRMVAGPLIWMVPAFSLAIFARQVAYYFNASARTPSTIVDLFNPFSRVSRANYGMGLTTLVLGLVAVVAVLLAVALMEQDSRLIGRTLRMFGAIARSVALTLALFMYSLAALNAAALLLGITKVAPFQVGAPGLLALLLGAGIVMYEVSRAPRPGTPTTPTTDEAPRRLPAAPPARQTPLRAES